MTPPLVSKVFRILWGLRIMPKWKIFLWKLWHNSLATTANLAARGISISDDCPSRALESETCQHLFRLCPLATVAWRISQLGIISNSVSYVSFQDWLIAWILYFYNLDGYSGERLPKFLATLWTIWQCRNNLVFNNINPDGNILHTMLQQVMQQHVTFLARPFTCSKPLAEGPGPPGFLIAHFGSSFSGVPQLHIQVDGSWTNNSPLAGIAWVAQTVHNQTQEGQGICIHADSALLAEAMACLDALVWAHGQAYQRVAVHTDSEVVVQSLRNPRTQPIAITWTLSDIRSIGQQFHWCRIMKVNRSHVQLAHDLAIRARRGQLSLVPL
ncbi:uncharacterized protein LOC125498460 [Beta vulgaris subsp. vulgaris]|uniref:uncharacterized protein LOC125498460 n=1 Tax=Beta vulgaris subsp. vulgaris TaxID=3555 RepID=UPI0005400BB0|nr:uncharacterized protein LOC125498460 [Beta vulgaris subsp. vulgaris]